jgi:hypothetical protein
MPERKSIDLDAAAELLILGADDSTTSVSPSQVDLDFNQVSYAPSFEGSVSRSPPDTTTGDPGRARRV